MLVRRKRKPIETYKKILIMGWIVYFINYLGRYNFSAAIVRIEIAEGYSPAQLGSVVSMLIIFYGAGQLVSGILGELFNPKILVTLGIIGSGVCNLIISFVSDPIVMRNVLIISYILIVIVGIGWIVTIIKTRGKYKKQDPQQFAKAEDGKKNKVLAVYISSGFVILLIVILVMGIMKDGIMTWIPKIITDTFGTSIYFSLFLSAVLPIINLTGIKAVKILSMKTKNNEVLVSLILYSAAFVVMLILSFTANIHPMLTIIMFSIVSACIFGISTVLISFLPLRFSKFGSSSVIAGIANSATYLGSAVSGWGLGFVAGNYGWSKVNLLLVGLCLIGILLCVLVLPLWKKFLKTVSHYV